MNKRQRTSYESEDEFSFLYSGGEESDYSISESNYESDESEYSSENSSDDDFPCMRRAQTRAVTAWQQTPLQWCDGTYFVPTVYSFVGTSAGFTSDCDITGDSLYIDYFEQFLSNDVMDTIVAHTNSYFEYNGGYACDTPYARKLKWRETNIAEMYVFFALFMLMAQVENQSLTDYWTTHSLTCLPIFRKYMSRYRFLLLMKFLHISNVRTEDKRDPLRKLQPVVTMLKRKFSQVFPTIPKACYR